MSKYLTAAGVLAVLALGAFAANAPARAESVMKECGAEWKTAKANNTTNGQTWPQFLKDCRGRHETASATPASAPAPAPSPAPTMMAPAPAPSPASAPAPMRTRMSKASAAPPAGEYANEGDAKFKCGGDMVVWVNNKSHKYHYAGNRSYGTTKSGGYMCENEAKSAGEVAAKNEKPKS